MGNTRDRILDAAQRCFYGQGITASGVDAIAAEAGVTKRTLYNHFGSKQELVAAYLTRRHERWLEVLDRHLAGAEGVGPQLDAVVDAYVDLPDAQPFRGCALINATAELVEEDDPALAIVRSQIDGLHRRLRDILAPTGATDLHGLATRVLMVLEGMCGLGGIQRSTAVAADGKVAVRAVVAAASTSLTP